MGKSEEQEEEEEEEELNLPHIEENKANGIC